MITTLGCFKALLALSGKPALEVARHHLLTSIRARDLNEVIKHTLNGGVSRAGLIEAAAQLLNAVATETATKAISKSEETTRMMRRVGTKCADPRFDIPAVSL
jgi:hypothetical protein